MYAFGIDMIKQLDIFYCKREYRIKLTTNSCSVISKMEKLMVATEIHM